MGCKARNGARAGFSEFFPHTAARFESSPSHNISLFCLTFRMGEKDTRDFFGLGNTSNRMLKVLKSEYFEDKLI